MKSFALAACAAAICCLSVQANATAILTFEGVGSFAAVNNFYNGGTDSLGNSGVNLGVSFTPDSIGLISDAGGGGGNFEGNPSGVTALIFTDDTGNTMDVLAGFVTGLSFYYASGLPGSVSVWSGLDGTGTQLGSLSLSANNQDHCAPDATTVYCSWDPVGIAFLGTAQSVIFSAQHDYLAVDDINIGSAVADQAQLPITAPVPEPASLVMLAGGLAALGFARSRKATGGSGGLSRVN
jgi:hypothetical protein